MESVSLMALTIFNNTDGKIKFQSLRIMSSILHAIKLYDIAISKIKLIINKTNTTKTFEKETIDDIYKAINKINNIYEITISMKSFIGENNNLEIIKLIDNIQLIVKEWKINALVIKNTIFNL